jgi:hypothetical protein
MARAAILGGVIVLAASACNAILGMEHAQLDQALVDSGAPGTGGRQSTVLTGAGGSGTAAPGQCSTPSDDCSKCVQSNCGPQMDACLVAPDCRTALEGYGKCAGSKCPKTAACGESLATSKVAAAAELGLCLSGCSTECAEGTAISMCEPYCRCMMANCQTQFRVNLGNEIATCVENCKSKGDILANVDCRAAHCEYAPDDPTLHCQHAIGMGFCPLPDPSDELKCSSGTENGYPCRHPADCCSGNCPRAVCMPSG